MNGSILKLHQLLVSEIRLPPPKNPPTATENTWNLDAFKSLKRTFLHEKKKRNWQIGAMLLISLLALFNKLTRLHFRTITCQ